MSTRINQAIEQLEQQLFEQLDVFEQIRELERRVNGLRKYRFTQEQFRAIIQANPGEPDEHTQG
jgi:hypothetical protein